MTIDPKELSQAIEQLFGVPPDQLREYAQEGVRTRKQREIQQLLGFAHAFNMQLVAQKEEELQRTRQRVIVPLEEAVNKQKEALRRMLIKLQALQEEVLGNNLDVTIPSQLDVQNELQMGN